MRARRLALGLNQAALADALSVRQATVARWEAGDRAIPDRTHEQLAALEDQLEEWVAEQTSGKVTIAPIGKDATTLMRTVAAARALVQQRRHRNLFARRTHLGANSEIGTNHDDWKDKP